jgi:hypothetical protein
MKVHEVKPSVPDTLLSDYADACAIAINNGALDARQAAEPMFAHHPRWVTVC